MKKILSTVLTVGIFSSMSFTPAWAADYANLPTQSTSFENSGATILNTSTSTQMNIQINDNVGKLYWDDFSIASGNTVDFKFTAANQTALNKVTGANVSQIYGQITNSGDYASSGKVFLINPNGILFGNGANINLNSFTASTVDLDFNKELTEEKNTAQSSGEFYVWSSNKDKATDAKIIVDNGATINGEKSVALIGRNIETYKGSLISGGDGASRVKLITSDGVNFVYNESGRIVDHEITGDLSNNKMVISLRGNIESNRIDIHNNSKLNGPDEFSYVSIAGANLKATRMDIDENGNIVINAANKINIYSTKDTNGSILKPNLESEHDIILNANREINIFDHSSNGTSINKDNGPILKAGANIEITGGAQLDQNVSIVKATVQLSGVTATAGGNFTIKDSINANGNQNIKGIGIEKSDIEAKNIKLDANNNVYILDSNLTSTSDNIEITSNDLDVGIADSILDAQKAITLDAGQNTFTQEGAELTATNDITLNGETIQLSNTKVTSENGNVNIGNDVNTNKVVLQGPNSDKTVITANNGSILINAQTGTEGGQYIKIYSTDLNAQNINSKGNDIWLSDATLEANNEINITANNDIYVPGSFSAKSSKNTLTATNGRIDSTNIAVEGGTSSGALNFNDTKAYLIAKKGDIDVELDGVGDNGFWRTNNVGKSIGKGLYAEANSITLNADTLAISDIIQRDQEGKLTINAKNVLASESETHRFSLANGYDSSSDNYTAYIEVNGKPVTGFVSNPEYTIDDSYYPVVEEGKTYNQYHNIKYGDQKVFLKWKIAANQAGEDPIPTPETPNNIVVDSGHSQMLNKLPRQPETYNNTANITDGRTQFVDVFAAASQIEIEEDEY